MRRDSIFYSLFQKYPNILFQLIDNPPANADNYRFDSVAVKEPKFEIDGVFLPPETEAPGTVYFSEFQFQKDPILYERLFAESMLYFYRNRERFEDWQAVVIYPTRGTEQTRTRPYRAFLPCEQVHRVYLDELGEFAQLPLDVSLLVLTTLKESEAPAVARYLVNRSQQELNEPNATRAIIEVISSIMSYRFTQLSTREIEAMLGIAFEQTRVYQEIKQEAEEKGIQKGRQEGRQEGQAAFILRLLSKKLGDVPSQLTVKVHSLSLQHLEALTDVFLDFDSFDDLNLWLQRLAITE